MFMLAQMRMIIELTHWNCLAYLQSWNSHRRFFILDHWKISSAPSLKPLSSYLHRQERKYLSMLIPSSPKICRITAFQSLQQWHQYLVVDLGSDCWDSIYICLLVWEVFEFSTSPHLTSAALKHAMKAFFDPFNALYSIMKPSWKLRVSACANKYTLKQCSSYHSWLQLQGSKP
jgi:hypothetical protein